MASKQPPTQCNQCGHFYLPHEEEDHLNMHIDPSKLAPKTSPNDMRKIELSKVIVSEERTDASDIALRSLLPDEIPKPEEERKRMKAPDVNDDIKNDSIYDPNAGRGNDSNNPHNYNRVRDRLDLTSKLASTDLSKDQLKKLEIEKQVEIKTIKTVVPKKEIHKFQNSHYSGKETKDLGGCGKKEMPNGLNNNNQGDKVGSPFSGSGVYVGSGYGLGSGAQGAGEGRILGGENQQGYVVKQDNSHHPNASKKATVVVPINRKTANPNQYKHLDTLANREDQKANKGSRYYNNGNGADYQGSEELSNSQKVKGSGSEVKNYDPNSKGHNGKGYGGYGGYGRHGNNGDHLHHHECPSCHGFYCQHCGSTIPPEYRPFWDPDESPEMVEYYKKRVRECRDKEREKERKHREGCGQCNTHKKQQQSKP